MVERLLLRHLAPGKARDRLFDRAGALANFSARIDLAYTLGLFSAATYGDLHVIRDIGNYFAHHVEAASFDESPVRDWCDNFWMSRQRTESFKAPGESGRARDQFNSSLVMTALDLERVQTMVQPAPQPPAQSE